MGKTLRQFIEEASRYKDELLDKEVVVRAENGELFEPTIKFIAKDNWNFMLDKEHIDKVIITV